MKKLLFLSALFSLCFFSAHATHLMGGEITVQQLQNGDHQITLIAYRDTVGIPMTTHADIDFNGPNGQSFTVSVPYDSIISGNLLPMYPYGVEIYLFVDTVTFPNAGLWNISWQNCCRNGAIQNLSNPLSENMLLQTSLVVDSVAPNSTPFFLVPAAIFLPLNTPWQYNPLPFDPDGDSLHWSIDKPLDAISQYCAGYSNPPSNPNDTFRIDPVTGTISWTASSVGNFVASILVDQYRNGQWVGEIRRDMQFIVVDPIHGYPIWKGLSQLPIDSTQQYAFNLTAGKKFKLEMLASHTDINRQVFMGAYSQVLNDPKSNATFYMSPTLQGNEIKGTFEWNPQLSDIRSEPYIMVFRASDGFFTDDKTIKLNVLTSVGQAEREASSDLSIYPNPATDKLYIDFSGSSRLALQLDVYNLNGQKIMGNKSLETVNGRSIFSLETNSWPPGAYLFKMTFSNGQTYSRMVTVQ